MRRTRLRDHSINRLIPNMLTLFALCAGLTSIKFALDANALMNVTLSTDQSAVADARGGAAPARTQRGVLRREIQARRVRGDPKRARRSRRASG